MTEITEYLMKIQIISGREPVQKYSDLVPMGCAAEAAKPGSTHLKEQLAEKGTHYQGFQGRN